MRKDKAAQVEYDRKRYLAHREEILRSRQIYQKKNPEKLKKYLHKYHREHKETAALVAKEYRRAHPRRIQENSFRYYRENRTAILGYKKQNPQLGRVAQHNRRARLRSVGGRLSIKEVQRVYEDNIKSYGTLTCYLCLKPVGFGQDSLDHKIPLSRGGDNQRENLAIAHKACNFRKWAKTEDEYRATLPLGV